MEQGPRSRLRLRQIALVAAELAPVEQDFSAVLGLEVCYRDPGVAHFGLENVLFPIGNQFLEVVAPLREGTAGGRYLERRGGDGGYMVITQADDHARRRARVDSLGVRVVNRFENDSFINMQLHPKDTGGSFFEIDAMLGDGALDDDGPWEPAGPDWQRARRLDRVSAIVAAELQCDAPGAVAERWSEIAEISLRHERAYPVLPLANAAIRYVPCSDGRPEGLGGMDLACTNRGAILAAARKREVPIEGDHLLLGGIRVTLRD